MCDPSSTLRNESQPLVYPLISSEIEGRTERQPACNRALSCLTVSWCAESPARFTLSATLATVSLVVWSYLGQNNECGVTGGSEGARDVGGASPLLPA